MYFGKMTKNCLVLIQPSLSCSAVTNWNPIIMGLKQNYDLILSSFMPFLLACFQVKNQYFTSQESYLPCFYKK